MNDINKIINNLNQVIKKTYSGFNGIYLYGSYASKKNQSGSDIDVVALFETPLSREQRLNLWSLIGKIEVDFGIVLDLHPMSTAELKQNPIYYNQVVNKGMFYGA
ncbi:nucleotidyltransferase domain-containing protein [bacterium]|nr:nucleotidyltransferase domain-containing protein [bacterium]